MRQQLLNHAAVDASSVFRSRESEERAARKRVDQCWMELGAKLPRPKAIVSVSAHGYIQDAEVTVSTAPSLSLGRATTSADFQQELYKRSTPRLAIPT